MATKQRTWAVVLAAGDGTRLARLTTDDHGNAVPKQYCSLNGGASLLDEAVQRSRRIVPRERLAVVVAESHRRFWERALWTLPASNVIAQPRNCGTANGVLLALLTILERDPLARIVFLPADHFVRDEAILGQSLIAATTLLTRNPDELLVLGIEPEEPDPELGYIVPGSPRGHGLFGVEHFVEKPPLAAAQSLLERGALWNSFIFAAYGPALLRMLRAAHPTVVDHLATAVARDARIGVYRSAVANAYEDLPSVDFSRAIMQGNESALRVLPVPACGWSDLGTPRRVAETLRRFSFETRRPRPIIAPGVVNLAAQHARLALAS
jgi:mannose-1-phosphate guanylyltransferase